MEATFLQEFSLSSSNKPHVSRQFSGTPSSSLALAEGGGGQSNHLSVCAIACFRAKHEGTVEHYLATVVVWLADGYFGVLWVLQQDLDFAADFLGMPRVSATNPCSFCPAGCAHDNLQWSNFSTDPPADWMQLQYGPDQWKELFPNRRALFSLSSVSVWSIACDWMHTKYLGSDSYLFGTVLWLMVYVLLPGSYNAAMLSDIIKLDLKSHRPFQLRMPPSKKQIINTQSHFPPVHYKYPFQKNKSSIHNPI